MDSEKETSQMTEADQVQEMVLTELEQVRVLSNPVRVRIMEQLVREELTTKQVAEALGEKPTRLYHHVEALEKIGLIRQTRTRRNRGTLERYYLAVAQTFRADPKLFAGEPTPESTETMRSVVGTILETTGRELEALVDDPRYGDDLTEQAIISFVQIEADEKTIVRFRRRIQRMLNDLQKLEDPEDEDAPRRRYRLTMAYYPVDCGELDSD